MASSVVKKDWIEHGSDCRSGVAGLQKISEIILGSLGLRSSLRRSLVVYPFNLKFLPFWSSSFPCLLDIGVLPVCSSSD
jgi:hypothetical protein